MQLAFLLGAAHIAFGATGLSGRWGVRAVLNGDPPPVTLEDGARAVLIAEACLRSAVNGERVGVEAV